MIIGLLGFIGSGKGTVATRLVENYGCKQDSFAASLKDACAAMFDWPRHLLEGDTKESREWREQVDPWWAKQLGNKNFTPRLALQLMGTDVIRNHFNDRMWFLTVLNRIRKNPDQHTVISDVRFPNEIQFLKDNGGKLIQINRGPAPEWFDTAYLANNGNSAAMSKMLDEYKTAHFSEWAWVGTEVDFVIDNNSDLAALEVQIDRVAEDIF